MSTSSNKLQKKGEDGMGKATKRQEMTEGRLCETGTYERVARERVACEKVVCEQVVCEKVCVSCVEMVEERLCEGERVVCERVVCEIAVWHVWPKTVAPRP